MLQILICKGAGFCIAAPYSNTKPLNLPSFVLNHSDYVVKYSKNGVANTIKNRTMAHIPIGPWYFLDDTFIVLNSKRVGESLDSVFFKFGNIHPKHCGIVFNKHDIQPEILLDFIALG